MVVVTLQFENGASTAIAPQPSDFKLQDSNGVRRGPFSMGFRQQRPDALKSDDLAPGGYVVGTIVFEAPREDRRLTLAYQPRRRAEVIVQLY